MSNYIGVKCPVCKKKFVEGDDIVVCPVCGAPHHRDCYALENKCAFEDEHINGKSWKPEPEAQTQEQGQFCMNPQDGERWYGEGESKTCAFCGAKNPKDNLFCCSCGNRLIEANLENQDPRKVSPFGNYMGVDPTAAVYGGLSPTEKIDEFSVKEVAAYVGRSSSYYLPRFKKKSEDLKSFDFSFSAFLFGFVYFFYRKMYKIGALLLALTIVITIPSLIYGIKTVPTTLKNTFEETQLENMGIEVENLKLSADDLKSVQKMEGILPVVNLLSIILKVSLGLFASTLYYKHTIKQMKKIKEEHSQGTNKVGIIEAEDILRKEGGVNTAIAVVFVVIVVFTYLGASGYALYRLMS